MFHNHTTDSADAVALAKSQTLNFDDVDVSAYSGAAFIPASYGGLTWSDGWVVANSAEWYGTNPYPNSGYFTGITSGEQIAFNNGGVALEVSAKSFNLDSFELTAAWDKKMTVEIVASKGGTVVYDQTVTVGDKHPTLITLGLKGIDDLVLTPTEVKVDPKSGGGSGSFMVIDDFSVSKVKSSAAPFQDQHHTSPPTISHGVDAHAPVTHPDLLHHPIAIA